MDKLKHGIDKIEITDATMTGVVIEPTLINFFFGNNGTGKTTVTRAIRDKTGLTWHPGEASDDFEVEVFDRDYIESNFRSFEKLKGVFTVGEINADTQDEITALESEKRTCDASAESAGGLASKKKAELDQLLSNFQDTCWSHSTILREALSKAMPGYGGRKANFATQVLSGTAPVEHDLQELQALCDIAFDSSGKRYPRFQSAGNYTRLSNLGKVYELFGQPITSSSDTEFARFVKSIKAADWIRQGHTHYTDTPDGKCPYCQQKLPDDFETSIASCFDAQYQQDMESLQAFYEAYESDMNSFITALESNLTLEMMPKLDITEYRSKLDLLKKIVEGNIRKIADKIKEPSSIIELDDVKSTRGEITALIESTNALIDQNNAIIDDKPAKQADCKKRTKELIAFSLAADIKAYNDSYAAISAEYTDSTRVFNENSSRSKEIAGRLIELHKTGVGTQATIDAVNKTLRDAGLQGFKLFPKDGEEHVYEVRRQNGKIAKNLSEGERNFIAFLYFYHVVRGSSDESGAKKPKIVVIDDPVSSLDSGVLFLVSSLVRELIDICYNNVNLEAHTFKGDGIEQIFVMTHNTYFHREITYNQPGKYDFVTFFLIQKRGNISTVKPCIRENRSFVPPRMENYNPVQNSYKALWSELNELSGAITTMSVIRRILEYYFLQLCGYDGMNLRKEVLETHQHLFIVKSDDDSQPDDDSKYHLAQAMLSYIGKNDHGFNDGIDFVDESTDVHEALEVFRIIFDCMGQIQHYDMMMDEVSVPQQAAAISGD